MVTSLVFRCRYHYPSGFSLNADFETDQRITALYGPSGSGKSTILSLIAGLLKPESGYIRVGDQVVTDTRTGLSLRPEARGTGLLFQDYCLFPHLRVKANIAYGARRRTGGVPLDRVVKALQLDEVLDRYPRALSGGQRERVGLARAICASPRVLLLDEPLTSVDVSLRGNIATFLETVVHEFKIPVLLVSHDHSLVERLATRVIRLEEGRTHTEQNEPHSKSGAADQ